jgi:hypothetical protein
MIGNKLALAALLGVSMMTSGCMSSPCPDCTPEQRAEMKRLSAGGKADQTVAAKNAEREQAAFEECVANYQLVKAERNLTDSDIKQFCS